ncbi:hypothetical protein ACFE04_023818 [Oxalis oulophora]
MATTDMASETNLANVEAENTLTLEEDGEGILDEDIMEGAITIDKLCVNKVRGITCVEINIGGTNNDGITETKEEIVLSLVLKEPSHKEVNGGKESDMLGSSLKQLNMVDGTITQGEESSGKESNDKENDMLGSSFKVLNVVVEVVV